MNDSLLTPEAESLIQGYVEGELTAPECTRLRELIEASPGLVTPILIGLRTEALIRQTVLQIAGTDLETVPETVYAGAVQSSRSRRMVTWLAAACLVGLAVLAAILWGPRKTSQLATGATQPSGSILYEYWSGVTGSAVADLTSHPDFQRAPTGSELLQSFEAPSNRGQDYGARVRGYLRPAVTGQYLFWIAADDAAELWLSADESPANKNRICLLESWAPPRDWTWKPSQQSQPIQLEAGRRYYIEALHKQGNAGDSLAVAWQPPGGMREIIPGRVLSPFSQSNTTASARPVP